MAKTCNYEECTYSQFGGGFCQRHQWCRTDLKKPKNQKKRKPIKKRSATKIKADRLHKDRSKTDHEFYLRIWEEREHIDFETGEFIPGEALTLYFHHVLPKRPKKQGGYPEFRHCKWNIVLVTWETHTKAETNLDLVPKIKAYRDELLKIHANGK